jgi:hypothetical protein
MMTFPLEQWFDVTKRIPREDADITEAQMLLYAAKDNIDPDGDDVQCQIKQMRRAVREHNRKFEANK